MRLVGLAVLFSITASCALMPRDSVRAHPLDETLWEVETQTALDRETLVQEIAGADVVIIGELHDNPLHHQAQAWLVGALEPEGMAFEMIPKASEEGIAVFLDEGGSPGAIGPAIGWDRTGWPSWELYKPIFDAWTPQIYTGGGVSRGVARSAIGKGAVAVNVEDAFDAFLSTPFPEAIQTGLEDDMVASHCGHLPRKAAPGMVEAQRLRDASFSAAVLRAREATAGGDVVLITGNGHTRKDRGVPAYLAAAASDLTVVSIGLLEVDEDTEEFAAYDGTLPFDYVWFTQPAEREDPCATFKK